MKAWTAAVAAALIAVTGCGSAPAHQPAPPTPGTPIARTDAAIAYDPETGQTVLFGGLGANGSLGDTWVWDGSAWMQQHPAVSPHSQIAAAMAYDPAIHALVLYGGDADAPVGAAERADMAATWLWTGAGWVRRDTEHSPVAMRTLGSGSGPLAYDAASRRIVMLVHGGGVHILACSASTWTFDGNDWRLEAPATPLPDPFVTLVADRSAGHVLAVLAPRTAVAPAGLAMAACPADSPEARTLPQPTTWRWTGATWVQVASGTEPVDAGPAPELDAVGGVAEVVHPADETLWSWTGSGWRMAPSSGARPPSRTGAQVALDHDGHVVLFGGYGEGPGGVGRYDTWTWSASGWTDRTGPAPPTPTPSPSVFTPPPD